MKGLTVNPHYRPQRTAPKSYRTRNGRVLLKSGRTVSGHGLLCLAMMGCRVWDAIEEDAQ